VNKIFVNDFDDKKIKSITTNSKLVCQKGKIFMYRKNSETFFECFPKWTLTPLTTEKGDWRSLLRLISQVNKDLPESP
jgi:hypothetical protein